MMLTRKNNPRRHRSLEPGYHETRERKKYFVCKQWHIDVIGVHVAGSKEGSTTHTENLLISNRLNCEISHCINIISFTLPLPCHRHTNSYISCCSTSCAPFHLLLPLLQLIARESYSYDFRLVIKMYTTLVVQVVHGDGRDNVYTLHCSLEYIYFGFIHTACHVLGTPNVQMYSLCSCSDIEKSKI